MGKPPQIADKNMNSTNRPIKKIALIRARWHSNIVDKCINSFVNEWRVLGHNQDQLEVIDVPGAFEIPLLAQTLSRTGKYEAIMGCAFVVNGGIYRHEFVSSAVIDGMMRVQLDCGVPILSTVLTPHNFQETPELIQFFSDHFVMKGREAAHACSSILHVRAEEPVAKLVSA